ncbi:patatin-like phospholipase family protein [Culturomica massiliensis]|uniref:patatin-like phospholipase family protein n=1 Tax=Culturomica massiliensis TaxID=1841857 RepID=UPI000838D936|nr:patatin-like phospholipase family protein [Culturomica massiliensis]
METNNEYNRKKYKLGLALSGGGARGFAHFGVIKAMQEYGIRPDIISGTSAGALAGAMIAAGKTPDECIEFFTHKKVLNFARFTMSKIGLMSMNGMENGLRKFLKAKTFEDLQTPLVVTATDISNAKSVHFNSGELIPRILASCSVPIVFIPIEIDGVIYVDGGIFMNLPVRPIRDLCEKVIAVEINSNESRQKVGNMIHMAVRSFHLGLAANTHIDKKLADIFIAPDDMIRYSMFDLSHIREIYEQGYSTAREILKDFQKVTTPAVAIAN